MGLPKKIQEVTGDWRRLYNEDLHGLYLSPSVIQMKKSIRMRWTVHVARKGERKCIDYFVVEVSWKETNWKI